MIFSTLFLVACSSEPAKTTPPKETTPVAKQDEKKEDKKDSAKIASLQKQAKGIFGVLPDKMPGAENDSAEKIALGKALYFETALSINDSQSCNSCHDVTNGKKGVDNEPTSPGAKGERGGRNSPSSVNAGFHIAQFWDGRAPDLKAQAKGPILNPIEMGIPDEATAIQKLKDAGKDYPTQFAKAFPADKDPMTYDNLAEAIAAFERTLISRDRFDKFQNGDATALNDQEVHGLELFIATGCASCHSSATMGGNSYQKLGVIKPYMPNGKENTDLGRFEVTKKDSDKNFFKVPSLRNIADTAPYFHDGQVATLKEAVQTMASIQLGKDLKDDELTDIVAFLGALSGDLTIK